MMGTGSQPKKVPWHMPNESNNQKRFLRVSVNTLDEATLFVVISKPKFPEYYIHNDTDDEIAYSQFKC